MCYYTQYKYKFVPYVLIMYLNNVYPIWLSYTINLNREDTEVGPDSRQVPMVAVGTTK